MAQKLSFSFDFDNKKKILCALVKAKSRDVANAVNILTLAFMLDREARKTNG